MPDPARLADRASAGESSQPDDIGDEDGVAEQLGDARAMAMFDIRLDRGSEATRFRFALLDRPLDATAVTLRRRQ